MHIIRYKSLDYQANLALEYKMKEGKDSINRVLQTECTGHSKHSFNNTREDSTHEHHQMVNTKIRLIILFAA